MTETPLETLAARVQACKEAVRSHKHGYVNGLCTYDELAQSGKDLSNAMFDYARAKFPNVKPKRIPYQAIIR